LGQDRKKGEGSSVVRRHRHQADGGSWGQQWARSAQGDGAGPVKKRRRKQLQDAKRGSLQALADSDVFDAGVGVGVETFGSENNNMEAERSAWEGRARNAGEGNLYVGGGHVEDEEEQYAGQSLGTFLSLL